MKKCRSQRRLRNRTGNRESREPSFSDDPWPTRRYDDFGFRGSNDGTAWGRTAHHPLLPNERRIRIAFTIISVFGTRGVPIPAHWFSTIKRFSICCYSSMGRRVVFLFFLPRHTLYTPSIFHAQQQQQQQLRTRRDKRAIICYGELMMMHFTARGRSRRSHVTIVSNSSTGASVTSTFSFSFVLFIKHRRRRLTDKQSSRLPFFFFFLSKIFIVGCGKRRGHSERRPARAKGDLYTSVRKNIYIYNMQKYRCTSRRIFYLRFVRLVCTRV